MSFLSGLLLLHDEMKGKLSVQQNGSLLAAVAMMAWGWDGALTRNASGFPADGKWVVRAGGFKPLP